MAESERYQAGIEVMEKLFGRTPKQGTMPDGMFRTTVENLFGDIWCRPGLELEERSMITLTALTVLGRENELKIHLYGAKNLGIPKEKLEEMMLHLAHYGGMAGGGVRPSPHRPRLRQAAQVATGADARTVPERGRSVARRPGARPLSSAARKRPATEGTCPGPANLSITLAVA